MSDVATRLMSIASQENNDGEEYDLMIEGYKKLRKLQSNLEAAHASIVKRNTEIADLKLRVEYLENILKEADDYLSTNNLTSIGHGSILHKKFKQK